MSNKKREPLLSDQSIRETFMYGSLILDVEHGFMSGANYARHEYEAARAKDAELIQRLLNALEYVASYDNGCPWPAWEKGYSEAWAYANTARKEVEAAGFKVEDDPQASYGEPMLRDKAIESMVRNYVDRELSFTIMDDKFDAAMADASRAATATGEHVRDFYEAARAKDAELIQQLMDGLHNVATLADVDADERSIIARDPLAAAEAAGFKPTEP
jgi:hypothetical protein